MYSGAGMPLKANLDGHTIVSVLCSDEAWSEAQIASKGAEHRLRMSCCDAPAYASHSPLDLRYFAHKPGHERCSSGGASDEHECLKAAAARTVQSLSGWTADVEVSGEGWRADVLAVRRSVKVAIEIQLSAQAKRKTSSRNDKFQSSEVSVFWLKGSKNHSNDFGDGLQAPVEGITIGQKIESVRSAVRYLLGAVERQVQIANDLARLIRSISGWTYEIEKQGTIPACFNLHRDGKKQQILLGELGAPFLPTIFRPVGSKQIGADQFAGAILQVRVNAPHLRGYQSSSFQLDEDDLTASLERQLRPILEGNRKWQGREHTEVVPGSFVNYPEECATCGTQFLRITHLLIGHPRHPRGFLVKIINDDWPWYELILDKINLLQNKTELPLGPLINTMESNFSSENRAYQICPKCNEEAPEPLVSCEESLRLWPDRDAHFYFRLPLPGKGWSSSTSWEKRPLADPVAWHALLDARRAERLQKREDERQRQELAEAMLQHSREKWERQAEEQRLQRIAADETRKAKEEQRVQRILQQEQDEQRARVAAEQFNRQNELRKAAEIAIRDPTRRQLWLTTGNHGLRATIDSASPRPIEFAATSKEALTKTLNLLKSIKF